MMDDERANRLLARFHDDPDFAKLVRMVRDRSPDLFDAKDCVEVMRKIDSQLADFTIDLDEARRTRKRCRHCAHWQPKGAAMRIGFCPKQSKDTSPDAGCGAWDQDQREPSEKVTDAMKAEALSATRPGVFVDESQSIDPALIGQMLKADVIDGSRAMAMLGLAAPAEPAKQPKRRRCGRCEHRGADGVCDVFLQPVGEDTLRPCQSFVEDIPF